MGCPLAYPHWQKISCLKCTCPESSSEWFHSSDPDMFCPLPVQQPPWQECPYGASLAPQNQRVKSCHRPLCHRTMTALATLCEETFCRDPHATGSSVQMIVSIARCATRPLARSVSPEL